MDDGVCVGLVMDLLLVGSFMVGGGQSYLGSRAVALKRSSSGEGRVVLVYEAGREGSCCDGSGGADGGHEL